MHFQNWVKILAKGIQATTNTNLGEEYCLEQISAYLPENGSEAVNSLSEGLEGIPTWLDLHSVQRDKGSVKEWQEQYCVLNKYGMVTQSV